MEIKNIAEEIVGEFERVSDRYFTYHMPKDSDDIFWEIYIHEPVLEFLVSAKDDFHRDKRFGYYLSCQSCIDIKTNESFYRLNLGFYIVHAKNLAVIFGKNMGKQKKIEDFKALYEELHEQDEDIYYLSYSSRKVYNENIKNKINNEFNQNVKLEDIENFSNDYPIINKEGTGIDKGKAKAAGSYFYCQVIYKSYDSMEEMLSEKEIIVDFLMETFGFLYKALFPSKAERIRNTDQWRIMRSELKKSNSEKICEIEGCETIQENVQTHHIHPVSRGGKDKKSNLINLCSNHHKICGTKTGKVKDGYLVLEDKTKLKISEEAIKRFIEQ